MATKSPSKKTPKAAPPPPPPPPLPAAPAARRKGGVVREWLVIPASGRSYLEEVSNHSVMRRTGLPSRDLRLLDPFLGYPSSILGRERAIVVNLEHVRAVITATEVLVLRSRDPLFDALVCDLQSRVPNPESNTAQKDVEGGASGSPVLANSGSPGEGKKNYRGQATLKSSILNNEYHESSHDMKSEDSKVLPFEFRTLEVCLESACKCLESETSALEKEAYPTLDELTSKLSTLNLERVRQLKSRLVGISGRAQKVRDEIEHLLDDEMDMVMMHLSRKLFVQAFDESLRFKTVNDEDGVMAEESNDEANSSEENTGGFKPGINELEMLLEAYFVQIEGLLNKLKTLREYVDDTEDYINIMLDDKQNQMLQMGVTLTTAIIFITISVLISGLLSMNIRIPMFDFSPLYVFWEAVGIFSGGSFVLYILSIWGAYRFGLLR